ncbi:uncharacterized WD repeat-containing protein alr2800-like isoform X1 [Hordeum vulgare subsp. vulgare]|uniref:Anaphase-promoting complex subunit 4 WD40 domain-containing protein n=1 Tax=Hordeum vulgare subsp. vulgare TaxID=112509 RepID=A0A8I6X8G8_HORVV|nr:uncharacterized WD repeat-containing protein alr2800-like isoform X1 [Hordeum vulgare subsp. vulgare]
MAATPPPPDAFAFSPDGELFAAVSDRRIQVWSTRGGQKIAGWTDPIADQDDSYSCIACSSVWKKQKNDGDLIVVAVGTANGEVLALDSTGVIWKNACHTGKVISLHFSKQGRVLITASMDGVICELDTCTGKPNGTLKVSKKSINSLTVSHDEKFMVVSGKTAKLYSMKDKKEILKIPSDDGPIQLMSVSDEARTLVSCTDNNKEVKVWSCDHHNCTIISTVSLVMHTQPKTVECKRSTSYEAGGIVLAVSKKGVAYVWHLQTLTQDEVVPTKISVKKSFDKKGRVPIILAKLCDAEEDNTIKVHVVFGSLDCLQFKIIVLGENCEDINLVA